MIDFSSAMSEVFGFLSHLGAEMVSFIFSWKALAVLVVMPLAFFIIVHLIRLFRSYNEFDVQDWSNHGFAGFLKRIVKEREQKKKKSFADMLLKSNPKYAYVTIDGKKYYREGLDRSWRVSFGGRMSSKNSFYVRHKPREMRNAQSDK